MVPIAIPSFPIIPQQRSTLPSIRCRNKIDIKYVSWFPTAASRLSVVSSSLVPLAAVSLRLRLALPLQHVVAHSARQSHGHTHCVSKQSDWGVCVTHVTNGLADCATYTPGARRIHLQRRGDARSTSHRPRAADAVAEGLARITARYNCRITGG